MSRAWTWWLAWGFWALFVLLLAGVTVLDELATTPDEEAESLAGDIGTVVAFAGFATVGALIASRRPRNSVGWLFIATPLLGALAAFGYEYAYRALLLDPGSLPGGFALGWVYVWAWYPAVLAIALVPLVFPTGRPPGRGWELALWAFVACGALVTVAFWFKPGPIDDPVAGDPLVWPDNPLGIESLTGLADVAEWLVNPFLLTVVATSLASVVVRFRRSRAVERQQLKWMLAAVGFLVACIVVGELVGDDDGLLFAVAINAVPLAAGVAILRYRLYEIDVVIRKTLIYAMITLLLGATYAGVVVGMQALLRPVTGASNLAIAVSTLVVAALFLPVRARVQRLVDRRFYRRRYDAHGTLAAFGARLRERVALDGLRTDLEGVVLETMQPAHVSLWRREAER
jgi:hypothetical protein